MSASAPLSFARATSALSSALTFGIHPSLDAITAMVNAMGRPDDSFLSVQITGTNGKSSTARLTAAMLVAHGLVTGCYTSPHLDSYVERIEIGDSPVSECDFARAIEASLCAAKATNIGEPTEFELLTAAALWLFRERQVDAAVLEVGMGGTWDATTVVNPAVAVITGVGLDHTAHLGNSREEIAADKAHIIKAACTPILGPGTEGVESYFLDRAEIFDLHPRAVRPFTRPTPVATELTIRYSIEARPDSPEGHTLLRVVGVHADYGVLEVAAPAYQAPNVATAIASVEAALGRALDPIALALALSTFRMSARFESISRDPVVIADGSHNPQAARVLARAVADAWPDPGDRPALLLGVLADKDARGIVDALKDVGAAWFLGTPDSDRALASRDLAAVVREVTGVEPVVCETVGEALDAARGSGLDVVATGSLVTAAEARRALRNA